MMSFMKIGIHHFEKNDYLGGHTNTKTIKYDDKIINVDTGFIVFNKLMNSTILLNKDIIKYVDTHPHHH